MEKTPVLESGLIRLRAPEPGDIELLYQWENDPSNWKVSNTLTPFSKYIIARYIRSSQRDIYESKELKLIIDLKEENRSAGAIDLFDFDPYHSRAGIGILIAATSDRRRGIASDAVRLIISYAFGTLGLHQLYCNISADNEASIQLFVRQGFRITGNMMDWYKSGNSFVAGYFLQLINQ